MDVKKGVPGRQGAALESLLEAATVHSYVTTSKRAREVVREAQELPCASRLAGIHACCTVMAKPPGASTSDPALSLMTMQRPSRSVMPGTSSRWQSAAGGRAMAPTGARASVVGF